MLTVFFLNVFSTESNSDGCSREIIGMKNKNYCDITCKICNETLFPRNTERDEIIKEMIIGLNSLEEKYSLISYCEFPTHIIHVGCLSNYLRSKRICPFCNLKFYQYFENQVWLRVKDLPEFYQDFLLCYLQNIGIKKLISLMSLLKNSSSGINLKHLKELAGKNIVFENLLKTIEIYEEENNDLCFVARVLKEKDILEVFTLFDKEHYLKLTPVQMLKVCTSSVLYPENQNSKVIQIFNTVSYGILNEIKDCSINITKEELILLIDMIIDFKIEYIFYKVIFDKLVDAPILPIDEMYRLSLKTFESSDSNKDKIGNKLVNFSDYNNINTLEENLEFIFYFYSHNGILDAYGSDLVEFVLYNENYEKFTDDSSFLKFVSIYRSNPLICNKDCFFFFLANQSNMRDYSVETVNKFLEIIFETEHFKNDFIHYLIKSEKYFANIKFYLIEKMLSSEDKNVYVTIIQSLFCRFKDLYTDALIKLSELNLTLALEEFMNICIKDKHNCIKTERDSRATLKMILIHNELAYLSYYLLDFADLNLSKEEIIKLNPNEIFDEIFKNADFDKPESTKEIYFSNYNFPLLSLSLTNLVLYAYECEIPPEVLLDKIDFDEAIEDVLFSYAVFTGISDYLKISCSEEEHNYFKGVFSVKREKILSIFEQRFSTVHPGEYAKIKKF